MTTTYIFMLLVIFVWQQGFAISAWQFGLAVHDDAHCNTWSMTLSDQVDDIDARPGITHGYTF